MVMKNKVVIASGVLAASCAILIILLVYLIRAYQQSKTPHSPRNTVKQPIIPPCIPYDVLRPHKPQPSIVNLSKSKSTEEFQPRQFELTNYGPDMEEFYSNCRHPISKSISMDNLNTPPRDCKIKKSSRKKNKCSSQSNALSKFCRHSRNSSEQYRRKIRSMTTSTYSESVGNCDAYYSDENQQLMNDSVFSENPSLGEILISLRHNPSEGKLTITFKSAKDLPEFTQTGKIHPFIKIRVYDCGEIKYKKTTTIQQDTNAPKDKESFDFVVTHDRMPQTSVILRLYHHGRRVNFISKNILIGIVFLGYQFELFEPHPFTLDCGARHWASIIERPHLTIEEWHPIQALFT